MARNADQLLPPNGLCQPYVLVSLLSKTAHNI